MEIILLYPYSSKRSTLVKQIFIVSFLKFYNLLWAVIDLKEIEITDHIRFSKATAKIYIVYISINRNNIEWPWILWQQLEVCNRRYYSANWRHSKNIAAMTTMKALFLIIINSLKLTIKSTDRGINYLNAYIWGFFIEKWTISFSWSIVTNIQ